MRSFTKTLRHSLFAASAAALALLPGANHVQAGLFSDDFEEAATAAGNANTNRNKDAAKEELETAGTIKTAADYVGAAATAGTIGAEIYDWVGDDAQKKVDDLNKQYRAAMAQGDKAKAQDILNQLKALGEQKRKVAKDGKDMQESIATIQTVAGVANLGAAAASGVAAYKGFGARSQLQEGCVRAPAAAPAAGAPQASPGAAAPAVPCTEVLDRTAIQKARGAAMNAVYYAAGEAAVGTASLMLAGKHRENANRLGSIADDPTSDIEGYAEQELALFDRVALEKCGMDHSYELLAAGASVNKSKTLTTPSGSVVRSVASTASDSVPSEHREYFDRVRCIEPVPVDSSGGGTTVTRVPSYGDRICGQDLLRCSDGSFVGRDPAAACDFRSCPIPRSLTEMGPTVETTGTANTTTPTSTTSDTGARSLAATNTPVNGSSGASRLRLDDVSAEVDRDREAILRQWK